MKIKSKIQTINTLPAVLGAALIFILFLSYSTVSEIMKKDRVGEQILSGAYDLSVLTTSYIMYPSDRPKDQWRLKHRAIKELLDKFEFKGAEEKRLIEKIMNSHHNLRGHFNELVDLYETPPIKRSSIATYEESLKGQLMIHSDSMVADTVNLSNLNYASLMKHIRDTTFTIAFSVIILMLTMIIVTYIMGQSIIIPISRLRKSTEIIAGGNLDHKTGINSSDELGQLSRAFDDMGLKLKASQTVLTEEISERKTTQDSLHQSRNELNSIYNAITDFLTVIDTDFRILRVNHTIEIIWGKDLIGKVCYEAYQGRNDICPDCPTAKAIATGKPAFSIQNPLLEGAPSVEISTFPILSNEGKVIAVVEHGKDISKRVMSEKALKESEEKYRRLFTTVSTAWAYHKIVTDNSGKPLDYLFLEVNGAFEKMTGLKKEYIIGKSVTEVLPGTELDPADWIGKYGEVALTGKGIKFENYSETINKWFLVSATCPERGYFITVFDDITERIQLEMKITQEKKRLEEVTSYANCGLFLLDEQSRVTYANSIAQKWFGPIEQLQGELCHKIFNMEDPENTCAGLAAFRTSETVESDIYMKTVEGEFKHFAEIASPVRDNKGNPIQVTLVVTDVTARKRAEEQVKSSLTEKEVLLQEIHHRVKNNMMVITSLLSLQSRKFMDGTHREMFNESINRIKAMSMIHEKLYKSEDLARVDFKNYISEMVKEMYHSYGVEANRVILETSIEEIKLGLDTAIPFGLIVNELVSNALKHAFPGDLKGTIKVSMRHRNGSNELIVSDNGIGMPEKLDIDNIDSLGINLVKSLTRQIKGEVDIIRNTGTEVKITFKERA